jgi:SAM-dependent methyltransferase
MMEPVRPSSASLQQPDYWWYRARSFLLEASIGNGVTAARALDVGSADGPSVGWLSAGHQVSLDVNPQGLAPGDVCGSALALPFRDGSFDLVSAFDVLEHCEPEADGLAEMRRVLTPRGRLLLSVPAYQWAWSDHDVRAGHHRRYTRDRLVAALERAGFQVDRCTHIFGATFAMFAAERLVRRLRPRQQGPRLPTPPRAVSGMLIGLCRAEQWWLRRRDLPFGSSVVVAATRVQAGDGPAPE